jgi:putative tryptophan/tyrosine transport system substrate-binding protein
LSDMRRREFITLLGGAVAWPLAVRAQQIKSVRRLGVLMPEAENDAQSQAQVRALEHGLTQLGWSPGKNLQIDYRWAAGDLHETRLAAAELVRLAPDVLLAAATPPVRALQQATNTIPIVFAGITEPVAQGLVASLAHPGGNLTGFSNMEATFGEKWLELLKEIDPRVTRAAIVFNPQTAPITADLLHNVEVAAQMFAIQPIATPVRQISEIETAAAMLAREPDGGMILLPDSFTTTNRKPIIEAVARHRLPAVYPFKFFAAEGGLLSYGVDNSELYRRAAIYVDRILKGEKPADLPVQQPTKFELVINLKTAKALGLDVPPTLLARADEVIE